MVVVVVVNDVGRGYVYKASTAVVRVQYVEYEYFGQKYDVFFLFMNIRVQMILHFCIRTLSAAQEEVGTAVSLVRATPLSRASRCRFGPVQASPALCLSVPRPPPGV